MPITIEVTGISGSGKTYWCAELAQKLKGKNIDYVFSNKIKLSAREKLFWLGVFFGGRPILFFVFLRAIFNKLISFDFNDFYWTSYWAIDRFSKSQYILHKHKKQKRCIILQDEGLLHLLGTLVIKASGESNNNIIKSYLKYIPKPELLIVRKSSVQECLSRIKERGLPKRLHGQSDEAVEMFLKNFEKIVLEFEGIGKFPVIVGMSVNEVIDQIEKFDL